MSCEGQCIGREVGSEGEERGREGGVRGRGAGKVRWGQRGKGR